MKEEQGNTDYDLYGKLHTDIPNNLLQDVVVRFNPNKLTQNSFNILIFNRDDYFFQFWADYIFIESAW